MTSTSLTSLTCAHATPSEANPGMLCCLQNVDAGSLRGQVGYKPFNLSPNHAAFSVYAKRSAPIVFKDRASLPPEESRLDEPAAPAAPEHATHVRQKDDFPKEFFLQTPQTPAGIRWPGVFPLRICESHHRLLSPRGVAAPSIPQTGVFL